MEHRVLKALVRRQQERCPKILKELEKTGRKTSHWIWWVCPTQLPGRCDPIGSYVTRETASLLLASESAEQWRTVLETLCDLTEKNGKSVLPPVDHGRVHYFLRFWAHVPDKPEWMEHVLRKLDRFDWKAR
mmetsp:Transcript_79123/g.229841  ORF Transcript_79123/g.229841 Transcript_79123/m.229841 type:complete len:131 (-) Transcript_79123:192-584(-)